MTHPLNLAKKPYLCTRCGRHLVRTVGSSGFFWRCSYYPYCHKTFSDVEGKPFMRKLVDFTCPNCQEGYLNKYNKPSGIVWTCNNLSCHTTFLGNKTKPNLLKQESLKRISS